MEWKICSQCLAQRNNKINTSIFKSYSFWCLFKTKKLSIFVNYNLWNETNRNLYNIPDTFYNFTTSDKFTLSNNGTSETVWGTCVCVCVFFPLHLSTSLAINKPSVTTINCLWYILVT